MKPVDKWFKNSITITTIGLTLLFSILVAPTRAGGVIGDGTPGSCTVQALQEALDSGGLITFNCGKNLHIFFPTTPLSITVDGTTVDGGDLIRLSGSNNFLPLTVQAQDVTLRHLSITSGGLGGITVSSQAGLTLENSIIASNYNPQCGGGIYTQDETSKLVITDSTIQGNKAPSGGGICARGPTTIRDSFIIENRAEGQDGLGWGGGMWWYSDQGELLVEDSTFGENYAAQTGGSLFLSHDSKAIIRTSNITASLARFGGGLHNLADTRLERVTIAFNRAQQGAGIYNDFYMEGVGSGDLELVESLVQNNNAVEYDGVKLGGGLVNETNSEINNSTFDQNSAEAGGAIYNVENGFVSITGSTLANNAATNGAGGAIFHAAGNCSLDSSSCLDITNSTISTNTATGDGGGIFINSANTTSIWFATITGNRADSDLDGTGMGGGIRNNFSAAVNVGNTILAGNTESLLGPNGWLPTTGECAGTITLLFDANTLVQNYDHAHCTFSYDPNNSRLITSDPKLGPLQNNGGPTLTHMPLPGSPAIEHATLSYEPFDQRGARRPFDGDGNGLPVADLGAVEFGAPLGVVYQPLVVQN